MPNAAQITLSYVISPLVPGRFEGLGEIHFLEGKIFVFIICMVNKNCSGHNTIWVGTKNIWRTLPWTGVPLMTTGLNVTVT